MAGIFYVLGDLILDINVERQGVLRPGSDTLGQISLEPGGAGANVAVWLARSGHTVNLFGSLGKDWAGRLLLEHLTREGVDVQHLLQQNGSTGMICMLLDERGEKSMVTQRGVNELFSVDNLPPTCAVGAWLHISGYVLMASRSREAARKLWKEVQHKGGVVSLDTPSYAMIETMGPEILQAMTHSLDLLCMNEKEAETLFDHDYEQAIRERQEQGKETLLKRGEEGAIFYGPDETLQVPGLARKARDAGGAGDIFVALFLAARGNNKSARDSLDLANRAAAWKVEQRGAQPLLQGDILYILEELA